jgi:3-hydroxymyristoyl/3-hydroxydecanoyl-(acyl carrier protein) dehydratase
MDVPLVTALSDPGALLPYGHPALQVDRILSHEPRRLVAVKAVSRHELDSQLGDGAFPASLMIESFLQTCGLLVATELSSRLLIFGSARGIRVSGAAHAGDVLVHTVELVDRYEDTATFTGVSRVGEDAVLSVKRAVAVLRPADSVAAR